MRWWRASLLTGALAGALLPACDANDLSDADHVRTWATNGSALAVYSRVHEPLAFAFGASAFSDPSCPVRSDDGRTATIRGGCTAADGTRWNGTATITRGEGDVHTLVLEQYGSYTDPDWRTLTDGTATVTPLDESVPRYGFDVVLLADALTSTRVRYSGTVEGDYASPTLWNGSGTVTRDGFGEPTGTVQVTTVDELRDTDVCGQPLSGYTTIEAEGDRAVVTYDGATDCDEDKAATWTFNGRDRGKITGIDCAAAAGGGPARTPGVLVGALAVLGVSLAARRRRRSRTR